MTGFVPFVPDGLPVTAALAVPRNQVWIIEGVAFIHPDTLRRFPEAARRAELLTEARAIARRVVLEWAWREGYLPPGATV